MKAEIGIARRDLERLVAIVGEHYTPDSPTHDHSHLRRVASLATRLCAAEDANPSIAFCAAWLHDLHREARPDGPFFVTPEAMDQRATHYLTEAGIPAELHGAVLDAVHHTDRFSFSDRPRQAASLEAKCVRDADNLDALGAIGVARAFAFGGSHDIPIYRDDVPLRSGEFRHDRRPASTVHHFYEKLLHLPDDMETATGHKLAERRQRHLTEFLHQFMDEWHESTAEADLGHG